jgi:hypothetical protein
MLNDHKSEDDEEESRALHGGEAPEQLSDEDRLKRQAAAEEHTDVERERGRPPYGKL